MSDCTIIIPCYNEAARLDLQGFVELASRSEHRVLFVNDGSTDRTAEVLEDLVTVNPHQLAALHLPSNQGKGEAIRQGMLRGLADHPTYIGYWDADLATPLSAIDEFIGYLETNPAVDMLLGSRVRMMGHRIERQWARHAFGRLFAIAAATTLRLPIYDTQCGAKLLRAGESTRQLFERPFLTRWLFDVELLARYDSWVRDMSEYDDRVRREVELSRRIHEFPLSDWRDVAGSKVKPLDLPRALWQLRAIRRAYPSLSRPAAGRLPSRPETPASLRSRGNTNDSRADVPEPRSC
ncbi:MAG: glycosyltransferase [Planctomycetales bacterium]|nr:glycosyltransferase [Planctomycetales bacterium]